MTAEIAQSLGLDRPAGVLVADVWPGGAGGARRPAQGDVILAVDGEPVNDEAALNYRFSTRRPGEAIRLSVAAAASPDARRPRRAPAGHARQDEQVLAGRNPFDGATVVNLSPAAAEELGLDPFAARGVVVTKVGRLCPGVGLRPGDVVKALNGRQIGTTADLQQAVGSSGGAWRITVNRRGRDITANFQL